MRSHLLTYLLIARGPTCSLTYKYCARAYLLTYLYLLCEVSPSTAEQLERVLVDFIQKSLVPAAKRAGIYMHVHTCMHALFIQNSLVPAAKRAGVSAFLTLTAHRSPLTAHRSPLTAHRSPSPLTLTAHPHRSPSPLTLNLALMLTLTLNLALMLTLILTLIPRARRLTSRRV